MVREEDTKMAGHAKIVRQPKKEQDGTPHIKVAFTTDFFIINPARPKAKHRRRPTGVNNINTVLRNIK